MVTALFQADSLRTPLGWFRELPAKRENAIRTSEAVYIGAGARNRTGGLPFTRLRAIMPVTIAFAGYMPGVSHFRRWHHVTRQPLVPDSGAPERNQAGHADSQWTPTGNQERA